MKFIALLFIFLAADAMAATQTFSAAVAFSSPLKTSPSHIKLKGASSAEQVHIVTMTDEKTNETLIIVE